MKCDKCGTSAKKGKCLHVPEFGKEYYHKVCYDHYLKMTHPFRYYLRKTIEWLKEITLSDILKWGRISFGIALVIIGIIGLFVPILQGFLFIFLGLLIIGVKRKRIKMWIKNIKRKLKWWKWRKY